MNAITVESRYSGPPGTGNGGFVCGSVADYLNGPAEVTLRMPCPLETQLDVIVEEDQVCLRLGDEDIAIGRKCNFTLEVPEPVSFAVARTAAQEFVGHKRQHFPRCFVCGTACSPAEGLCIHAGPCNANGGVASDWRPHPNFADENGQIPDRIVWAALDCPGCFAVPNPEGKQMLLGRLAVNVEQCPGVDEECVVQAWHLGSDGRKHFSGTALYGAGGDVLARGRATWIELKAD